MIFYLRSSDHAEDSRCEFAVRREVSLLHDEPSPTGDIDGESPSSVSNVSSPAEENQRVMDI